MAKIDQPAPDFEKKAVVDGQITDIRLGDYAGKWLVMFFYPLDFTFVCPTEILEFDRRLPDFQEIGCDVLGVSVDSEHSHRAWIKTPRAQGGLGKQINYPLISDLSKSMTRDYGVLCNEEVAFRGLFIIDPKQVVRQITINGLAVGRNVDEVLRLVQAFQFVDREGHVCPCMWKKGSAGMEANEEGVATYLTALEED